MQALLVHLVLTALGGVAGRALAVYFSAPCHASATGWVCAHWTDVCTVAGAILTPLGYRVSVPGTSTRSDPLVVEPPALDRVPDDAGPPAPPSVLVDSQGTPIEAMSPDDPDWQSTHGGG